MKRLEPLDIVNRFEAKNRILSDFLEKYYCDKKDRINILEAGCGRIWNLDLGRMNYVLTGIDISRKALEIRKRDNQDLDEMVIGDLRTIELNNAEYDLIYCSYVLEHINGAENVLHKFFRWLKPNGLLVLIIPDRETTYGFITRFTPLWVHVLLYKYIRKYPNAGKSGCEPFPTYYDMVVSRRGIHDYCQRHGHKIRVEYGYKLGEKNIPNSFSVSGNSC